MKETLAQHRFEYTALGILAALIGWALVEPFAARSFSTESIEAVWVQGSITKK